MAQTRLQTPCLDNITLFLSCDTKSKECKVYDPEHKEAFTAKMLLFSMHLLRKMCCQKPRIWEASMP